MFKDRVNIEGVRTNPSCKATEQMEQVQQGRRGSGKNAVRQ